jgi:hypothetical protein
LDFYTYWLVNILLIINLLYNFFFGLIFETLVFHIQPKIKYSL